MNKKLVNLALVAGATLFFAARPAAANDWEGLSIGVGGGYGMINNQVTTAVTAFPGVTASESAHGAAGTGGFFSLGAGYDHDLFGPLIVGAFVDYDFSNIDTRLSDSFLGLDSSGKFKLDNMLSVGARIGYLTAPSTLFFSTFGYAHSDGDDLTVNFGPVSERASLGDFNGYFIGGGVETLIYDRFSIKAEYRYTSMRANDAVFEDSLIETVKPQIQTVRLSLNYRFGDGKKEVVDNSIPPITSSWTGPYLGVGTGYSIANNKTTFSGLPELGILPGGGNNSNEGGFVSFTTGYDYQFHPKFLIGAFGDADFSNLNYSNGIRVSDGVETMSESIRSDFKDILMVGGRVGYLTTPDTLLFVSGGYANAGLGDTTLSANLSVGPEQLGANTRLFSAKRFSGAFIGAGVETKIWDSLSIKAEYRYVDLSSEDMTLLPDEAPEINEFIKAKIDPDIQMGRVSLNWRFNGSPPPPETPTGPIK